MDVLSRGFQSYLLVLGAVVLLAVLIVGGRRLAERAAGELPFTVGTRRPLTGTVGSSDAGPLVP